MLHVQLSCMHAMAALLAEVNILPNIWADKVFVEVCSIQHEACSFNMNNEKLAQSAYCASCLLFISTGHYAATFA